MTKLNIVEMVVKAFEETGIEPMVGGYFPENETEGKPSCACGLGVLYYLEHGDSASVFAVNQYIDTKFGVDYRVGFVNGFDDTANFRAYEVMDTFKNKEIKRGYMDGLEVRKLVGLGVSE